VGEEEREFGREVGANAVKIGAGEECPEKKLGKGTDKG